MTEERIKQDTRTVKQVVEDIDLFDGDLMSMVFYGNVEAKELLLKIILKKNDIIVIKVSGINRAIGKEYSEWAEYSLFSEENLLFDCACPKSF